MKSWPNKALLLAGAACLFVAIPAFSQEQEAPESLLPPGFGDPTTLPPPAEKAPPAPPPSTALPTPSEIPSVRQSAALDEDEEELDALEQPRPTNYFAIPEGAERPVDIVGPLVPGNFGLRPDSFGRSQGAWLVALMRGLDAPLPSRWTSILLRRALLSRLAAPAGVHPVDWVAARADLLLRMGEADAARILVQSIDPQSYTPAMIEAAADTALATGDVAGLCPLVEPSGSRDTVWRLAEAMCAALEGEPARAAALVDEARRQGGVANVDRLLAEKVVGAGAETRRAASVEWEEVDALTPWRFGLASATGAEIPGRLVAAAPPAMQAWYARAAMVPLEQRLGASWVAASLGPFSSNAMVEIYAMMLDRTDPAEAADTIGAQLRTAWAGDDVAARMTALRTLWQADERGHERHGRLILTAGAAARIPPSADLVGDARNLVAAMLSGGFDRHAGRWGSIVQQGGDARAWALLALGAPAGAVEIDNDGIEALLADDEDGLGRRRAQLLIAGLAGLGRIDGEAASSLAANAGFVLGAADPWTRAIDGAARNREPGTVALLAAVGMQTGDWRGVPPSYLFRITRALRAVGLDFQARMIAAEAVARL